MAKLEIYKRGQGKHTRILTFVGAMGTVLIGAVVLSGKLDGYELTRPPLVRFGLPTVVVLAAGLLLFWFVNRPKSADFLIATESEMKKVSWSSKKEIVGSTKVVIVFTFILAALLFTVDVAFAWLFRACNVMG